MVLYFFSLYSLHGSNWRGQICLSEKFDRLENMTSNEIHLSFWKKYFFELKNFYSYSLKYSFIFSLNTVNILKPNYHPTKNNLFILMGGPSAAFGFYYKGKYYLCEKISGGYPCIIGHRLVSEMLEADFDEWAKLLDKIKEVSSYSELTPEDYKKISKRIEKTARKEDLDRYELLLDGSFYYTLKSGYLVNIAHRSSDEEFIYILDLDNKEFRCKGENLDLMIPLEKKELEKYARRWSYGYESEYSDPEDEDMLVFAGGGS